MTFRGLNPLRHNLMMTSAMVCFAPPDEQGGGANESVGATGLETGGQTQDNTGQEFDGNSFWDQPSAEATGTPGQPGSAESGAPAGGQNDAAEFGKQLSARLDAIAFDPAFTEEIARQVEQGDLSGINKTMAANHQKAVRESVVLTAQLMQKSQEALLTKVQSMIDQKLGTRDTNKTLEENFSMAKDPALRPIVQSVFDQAMLKAKGNRTVAVAETQKMLKVLGVRGAKDMGITTPPASPEDTFTSDAATSLVEELMGRG